MKNNIPKSDTTKLLNSSSLLEKLSVMLNLKLLHAFLHNNDENGVEPSTIESEFHSSSKYIPDPFRSGKKFILLLGLDKNMLTYSVPNSGLPVPVKIKTDVGFAILIDALYVSLA